MRQLLPQLLVVCAGFALVNSNLAVVAYGVFVIFWTRMMVWGREAAVTPLYLELVIATQGASPVGRPDTRELYRSREVDLAARISRRHGISDLVFFVGLVVITAASTILLP